MRGHALFLFGVITMEFLNNLFGLFNALVKMGFKLEPFILLFIGMCVVQTLSCVIQAYFRGVL